MNIDYWTSIAQISATFIGLVFVGVTIYTGSILKASENTGIGPGLEEVSSRLMISLVLSNLAFFGMPLITALCIIAHEEHYNPQLFYLSGAFGLFIILLVINESPNTKRQFEQVASARSSDNLYKVRLYPGKWLLYICLGLNIIAIWLITRPEFDIKFLETSLEILVFGMLSVGLCFGLVDILLFDVKQIIFKTNSEAERRFGNMAIDAKLRMDIVENLFIEYCQLGNRYLEATPDVPENIAHKFEQERSEIKKRLENFRKEIPVSGDPLIFLEIKSRNGYLTLKEALVLKHRWDPLSHGIDQLIYRLENKVNIIKSNVSKESNSISV